MVKRLRNLFPSFKLTVDGNWGEWSKWSKCTKSCTFGMQSRTRKCNNPAPAHGGNDCQGPAQQNRKCNKNVPCPGELLLPSYITCVKEDNLSYAFRTYKISS